MKMNEKLEAFERLLNIMDDLREKCPWDKEQTFNSLRKLTIEETYELAEAIIEGNPNEIKKELGDLILHIVFYAKIGSETKDFDIADIINTICDKLIYRHPHIYSHVEANSASEVASNWEHLKLKENEKKRVLDGVPVSLPAMIKANRIQEKVKGVGFDWKEKSQVWDKVNEELNELKSEVNMPNNRDNIESEFGDLFFSIINAARLYKIDPEIALEKTNKKFTKRFKYLEDNTLLKGKSLNDLTLEEMDSLWEESKKFE